MSTETSKLKLKKPVESDYFNINDFNGNMDKIDALTHIVACGNTAANTYSIDSSTSVNGTVSWVWKKYNDGTFTAYAYHDYTSLRCNATFTNAGTFPTAGSIRWDIPKIGISNIYNIQLTVRCSARMNFIIDNTENQNLTYVRWRLFSISNEGTSEQIAKRVFCQLDGTWK